MRRYYLLSLVAGLLAVTACHDAAVGPNESAPQSPSGGIEILPGNAGDPARSRLPDQDWPGSVAADLSSDPALGGLTVGRRRLYIVVDEAATVAAVNAALQQEKAKVIGGLRAEAVLVVEIPESGSVTRIRTVQSRWSTLGIFSTVALDSEMDFTWLPSNPNINAWSWTLAPADGNWGLEHARFAQAWNVIRPFSGRVNLTTLPDAVVMDDGFDPAHEDLTALRISNAVQTNTVQDHGTHVAGTISADWDNGRGIEGATPVGGVIGTALKLPLTNKTTFDTFIRTFDRILRRQLLPGQPTAVRVVNMSVGYNWRRNAQINADTSPASQALVRAHGEIAARQTHRAKSAGIAIVVAAGNDYASHSQWSNPFNWARSNGGAVRDQSVCGGVCASDNVITVEAHRAGGNLAGFSNRGGSLSAPGEGIVSLTQSPSPYPYDSWNGTSMAAPHVSGLLLMLAAFDPNLTPAELVSLVTRNDGTHPNGTGSRGVDAFSSMINYDLLRGGVRAQRSLVDTDDGTRDGNDRLSSASAFGDGHVTMRDFRRFRDAMLRIDVDNRDLLAGEIELNGPANSPKRDLNGDRRIYPDGGRFETIYSRFDFNGDGFLSRNAKPQDRRGDITDRFRNRTDFEILADAALWEPDIEDVSATLTSDGGNAFAGPNPMMPAAALRADRDGDKIVDYLRSIDLAFTLVFANQTDDFTIRITSYDNGGAIRFSRMLRYANPVCGAEPGTPPIPSGQTVNIVVTVPVYDDKRVDVVVSGMDIKSCSPLTGAATIGDNESLTKLRFGQDIARTYRVP